MPGTKSAWIEVSLPTSIHGTFSGRGFDQRVVQGIPRVHRHLADHPFPGGIRQQYHREPVQRVDKPL
jgi:hypothetical protein